MAGRWALAARRVRTAVHPAVTLRTLPAGIDLDRDVAIRLRDAVTLRANVFRPAGVGRYPVILSAHPYGKDRVAAASRSGRVLNVQYRLFPQPAPVRISAWTSWEAPDPAFWVPRGYVVVNADLRGGGSAQGRGELFSAQEAADYAELIGWAAAQSWSTGKVGLLGVSYLAISQYRVAALHPPGLAAICPWEGFSDLYRDFTHPGGVRETGFSILWSARTAAAARLVGDLHRELAAHPERDEWYAARTPRLEDITVPLLVCASFSDHNLHTRGSFEVFRRAGSAAKWLYTHRDGKWSHFYGASAQETQAAFFDHFLAGADNGWDQRPPVHLAVHERGPRPVAVTAETRWPPADLDWSLLHLDAAARTLRADPPPTPAAASFASRGHGLRFAWTVPADLDVIGPAALRLFVSVDGADDLNLFAGLRKFAAGHEVGFEGSYGYSRALVSLGFQRVAFRDLDPQLSTPAQPVHTYRAPEPLTAGEIVEVHIALLPHATRLRAGEVLRLDLRGRWHLPRNPLTGQFPAGYRPSRRARATVHTGPTHPATLLLGRRPVPAGG